ncbi:hypothetical protein AB0D99_30610 [Streptomyces sp. NPDC047971]
MSVHRRTPLLTAAVPATAVAPVLDIDASGTASRRPGTRILVELVEP